MIARLEVSQEQLVLLLVVALRLGPRPTIFRHVGGAHPKVVGLHAMVAVTIGARRLERNERHETARGVARNHVGIDVVRELMLRGARHANAVQVLAVDALRLATHVVGDASLRHQVALVCGVDEHRPGEPPTVLHLDGHDPPALLLDAAGREVEPSLEDHLHTRLGDPVAKHPFGDVRLERPHLLLVARPLLAAIGRLIPVLPSLRPGVVAADPPVKLPR